MIWLIGGFIVCGIAMAILAWVDRLHVPPGYDEACSRIDQELDDRGL